MTTHEPPTDWRPSPDRRECPAVEPPSPWRPCDRIACRYHLWGDLRRQRVALEDMTARCALDLAEVGPLGFAEIGHAFGVSRERIRQIEQVALEKIARALPGLREGVGGRVTEEGAEAMRKRGAWVDAKKMGLGDLGAVAEAFRERGDEAVSVHDGEKIRRAIRRKGLTIAEVVRATGIPSSTLYREMKNRKPRLRPERIMALSRVLDVELSHHEAPAPKRKKSTRWASFQKKARAAVEADPDHIGAALRLARTEAEISARELAPRVGCSSATLLAYENQASPQIPRAWRERIADELGFDFPDSEDELADEDETPEPNPTPDDDQEPEPVHQPKNPRKLDTPPKPRGLLRIPHTPAPVDTLESDLAAALSLARTHDPRRLASFAVAFLRCRGVLLEGDAAQTIRPAEQHETFVRAMEEANRGAA